MILCCGEAVIDMITATTNTHSAGFQPATGGAAVNTAIALARLGQVTGVFAGLSQDVFGQQIFTTLQAENVDVSYAPRVDAPTTLAFVHLSKGLPQFSFYDEASAGRDLSISNLPKVDPFSALVFGGISLINRPAAGVFEALMQIAGNNRLTMLDPNIRPALIRDQEDAYRQRLDRMMLMADILKFSDEDLDWLRPDAPEQLLMGRTSVVIHTHGEDGATFYSRHGPQHLPASPVKVSDTVGAGDTFNAGFLASLANQNLLSPSALACADAASLTRASAYGIRAATFSVTRIGANPPTKAELQ